MFSIRKAEKEDLERIMEIYRHAQEFMISCGNPTQWGREYPDTDIIKADIDKGICNVLCMEGVIHGVFALQTEKEPTYTGIEQGRWLNEDPYVTIHRISGDGEVKGIFNAAVSHCKDISDNVRIDTHEENHIMKHLIEKAGFKKCGIIYVRDGTPRIAYHWERQ